MLNETLNASAPIGVFDSGVGGLTVARAIRDLLPHESLIYVADTAHTPYGPRPIAEVRELALRVLDDLVARGVKMLVIACNTASAAVLRDAYERYDVPVVEVIAPTVRSALAITKTGRVGLIGTEGTITSRVYDDLFTVRPDVTLNSVACPRFVELVEAGKTSGEEVVQVATEYLAPLIDEDIDTLVLGCTHYPFLRGAIRQVVGPRVTLVSSDIETANQVYEVLSDLHLNAPESDHDPVVTFEGTGSESAVQRELANRMLGVSIPNIMRQHTKQLTAPSATPALEALPLEKE